MGFWTFVGKKYASLEPVRQHEKTLHYTDSTAFLGYSVFRFISECSATRKKHCIGQNAEFHIFDFLLYFEIQCIFPDGNYPDSDFWEKVQII